MDERELLDKLICEVDVGADISVPISISENLSKWKWGSYGWVSPASLIVTAAWRKYLYPSVDCCRIWASDENGKPIPGGYSMRSADELVTIPMLAKHDLCKGFCSPNSGMQGSRAIEKMRGLKRLDRDFAQTQRTVFDLKLFASILNDINELSSGQAKNVLKYLILIAKKMRDKRIAIDVQVENIQNNSFDPWCFLEKTSDPELTKCYVAACFDVLFAMHGFSIEGVSDHRTAADARAKKPGDISLAKNGECVAAIEVKDKSQHIDWQNINRAENVISNHPKIEYFMFVLESTDAATDSNVNDIFKSSKMKVYPSNLITVSALYPIYKQALSACGPLKLSSKIGFYIASAPDVKPETKVSWIREVNQSGTL
ncbi:restriction endonuclease, SacI family [Slackia sp.]|uniref:restriction endonuclease, SacI family n=1 Tax=Slackia sp. TaxID=2049041 RepID=UPI003999E78B